MSNPAPPPDVGDPKPEDTESAAQDVDFTIAGDEAAALIPPQEEFGEIDALGFDSGMQSDQVVEPSLDADEMEHHQEQLGEPISVEELESSGLENDQTEGLNATQGDPTDDGREPVPSARPWSEIAAGIAEIKQSVDRIGTDLSTEINALRAKNETINRLHGDLQDARRGLDLKLLRPLFSALIRLHDNMTRDLRKMKSADRSVERDVTSVHCEELLIILGDNGVTPMAPIGQKVSDAFDGSRQSIVRTVDTHEEGFHGTVAEAVTCGFNYEGEPFQKQKVTVFKYKEQAPETPGEPPSKPPIDLEQNGPD